MVSNLVAVCCSAQAQADADAVHRFVVPVGMTLVEVSLFPAGFSGGHWRRQRRVLPDCEVRRRLNAAERG